MQASEIVSVDTSITRLGVVLEPDGDPAEAEGVLNPASTRTRDGRLLLYPRCVARGNVSRVGIVEVHGTPEAPRFERAGFALEPEAPYERRGQAGGEGCEDPRVTFVPLLDRYLMAYTAFGDVGPRIAIAVSADGYAWERLGLVDFTKRGLPCGDDKDAAFFPEPVTSPNGVRSFAFYHRPMLHISAIDGRGAIPTILDMPARDRESTRIAYVPVDAVLSDIRALLRVEESRLVLEPAHDWGRIKTGGGTPPVRVAEGWLSLYHGVDAVYDPEKKRGAMRYSAGVVIHDAERPHVIRYRSPAPVMVPETADERQGIVNDVVFPTAIDVLAGDGRSFDVYYGMADAKIGRARFAVGATERSTKPQEEDAA